MTKKCEGGPSDKGTASNNRTDGANCITPVQPNMLPGNNSAHDFVNQKRCCRCKRPIWSTRSLRRECGQICHVHLRRQAVAE